MRRSLVTVVSVVLMVGACGDDSDPAALLADYAEARNSGDTSAVMEFYAEDAVVENHPLDSDGVANETQEIRALEAQVPGIQGPNGGIEFTDIVVSGSTVTFNHQFINTEGACFGGPVFLPFYRQSVSVRSHGTPEHCTCRRRDSGPGGHSLWLGRHSG